MPQSDRLILIIVAVLVVAPVIAANHPDELQVLSCRLRYHLTWKYANAVVWFRNLFWRFKKKKKKSKILSDFEW